MGSLINPDEIRRNLQLLKMFFRSLKVVRCDSHFYSWLKEPAAHKIALMTKTHT